MRLELTTDRYPPITSQTRYPLRHAASNSLFIVDDACTLAAVSNLNPEDVTADFIFAVVVADICNEIRFVAAAAAVDFIMMLLLLYYYT